MNNCLIIKVVSILLIITGIIALPICAINAVSCITIHAASSDPEFLEQFDPSGHYAQAAAMAYDIETENMTNAQILTRASRYMLVYAIISFIYFLLCLICGISGLKAAKQKNINAAFSIAESAVIFNILSTKLINKLHDIIFLAGHIWIGLLVITFLLNMISLRKKAKEDGLI